MITQMCYTGSNYDPTKELTIGSLSLFIERDLKKLSDRYYELSMSFHIQSYVNTAKKETWLDIEVSMDKPSIYSLVEREIEEILWSYNKQLLVQSGGRFYTYYIRFEYLIKYKPVSPSIDKV